MTQRDRGTLYLVTRPEPLEPERTGDDVVEAYPNRGTYPDVAEELWSLAGDRARATAIHEVVLRAWGRDSRRLHATDIEELLGLLAGLEDALRQTITDDHLDIRPERMAEVRQRAELIDVDEDRGDLAKHGVLEGVSRVRALRNILSEALERELDVAVD